MSLGNMSNWPWSTIWSAVQAIGVPLSLALAYLLPLWQDRRQRANDLVAFRNIARMTEIFLPDATTMIERSRKPIETVRHGVQACHQILQKIDLARVYPASMAKHIAHIDVMASQYILALQDKSPDLSALKYYQSQAAVAMACLDQYLEGRHHLKDGDNFLTERRLLPHRLFLSCKGLIVARMKGLLSP